MPDTGKKIVLCVDDMPEVLMNINAILKNQYDVRSAIDIASALRVLETTHVDLLLLDIEMPEMSGIDFFAKLQKDARYQNIPVVFLTADTENKTAQKAIKKGAKGYLTKPVSPAALLESVSFFFDEP